MYSLRKTFAFTGIFLVAGDNLKCFIPSQLYLKEKIVYGQMLKLNYYLLVFTSNKM